MRRLAVICVALVTVFLAGCGDAGTELPVQAVQPVVPVYTTSFVCRDGNTPVQDVVCGNQQLAALDVQMAAIFRQRMGSDSLFRRDQVLALQRGWFLGRARACNVTAPDVVDCLATSYAAQIAALTNLPDDAGEGAQNDAITKYVQYKLLDAKQPALCASLSAQSAGALDADGSIDPARLDGGVEIAGSHGEASGVDPQGGSVTVDLYRAGLYGGYQIRARSVTFSGAGTPVLGPASVGDYVETMPNGGGRFVDFASQTGDYGAIDVFTLNGALLALITDTIGYNSPAPPGEAAVAALFTVTQGAAAPACLFQTYLMPPPVSMSTIAQQPALAPFLALIDSMTSMPPAALAPSDRQDTSYFSKETRWMLFNMPLVVLQQGKAGHWIGWLRHRHDDVLDGLYAWSQQSARNRAVFEQMFALLRPAATDLATIYVQQQGMTQSDAAQATALAMMELLYQATTYVDPGLGGTADDPAKYQSYQPRYPILANPQS